MTEQFDLWSDDGGEQQENLERVSSRIERAILGFCREHREFHADDLRRAVITATGIAAPASADRILRLLRQRGKLDYRVVNRRESLYEVMRVSEAVL
jgi:hypothetical protein